MERRTALALATAAAGTVLAATAAFAANVGLLEQDNTPSISVLDTSSLTPDAPLDPTVVTVVVEDPPVQGAVARAPATVPAGASNPTSASAAVVDDGYVDDGYDDSHEADDDSSVDGEHEERPDDDD